MTKNANQQSNGRDPTTGRFAAGNAGRPKGSRNLLSERFLLDLRNEWEASGVECLRQVAKTQPHIFVKVVAGLLPQQVDETLNLNLSVLAEIKDFVEAYRYALHTIGSDRAKLIEAGNGSD
jgi:hypothetical protein